MQLFDTSVAMNAVAGALPLIESMMELRVVNRSHLYIVVGTVDGAVLYMESVGDHAEWEHPYDDIARSKFRITCQTGMPSRLVQEIHPELVPEAETVYWGSWIDGGVVVACSGVEPWFDEAFAKTICALCVALIKARREMVRERGVDFYSQA
ncbi:hypothetical protein HY441_00330 [Candidatus Microgenomates bacterium]|nr:hypothetical protein [Candidatus Microgenomates bacterium]